MSVLAPSVAALARESAEVAVNSWPAPAAAIRVVDREHVLCAADAGLADPSAGRALGLQDRFEIGSISKSLTGFLIAGLAVEGRLELHDPLTDHLPWFSVRTAFAPITLRHLLQHTSGLITGSDALPDALPHAVSAAHTETGSAPGALFHYSNLGYVLLGLVVEQVTGQSLARAVTDRILRPAGMHESAAAVTAAEYSRLAVGHEALHADRPHLPGDPLRPATWLETVTGDGNVIATADDLARYARLLLGRGSIDGCQVITEEAFSMVTTDLAHDGEPSEHPSRYGLGLNTELVGGHTWLTHGGGMIGYSTFLAVDLDAGRGVVALTTAPGEWPIGELMARPVMAAATGHESATPLRDRSAVDDPSRYLGTYADADHEVHVERDGDGLLLRDADATGRLYETGQGRLVCDHPRWRGFPHSLSGTDDARRWTYGPIELRSIGTAETAPPVGMHQPLVGEYRCYSPWYPSFAIVARGGRLHLVAFAGVEAHTDEPELVELEPGRYRIGLDPRLPERLIAGPIVDGRVVWVDRDGCRYGRSFRPARNSAEGVDVGVVDQIGFAATRRDGLRRR